MIKPVSEAEEIKAQLQEAGKVVKLDSEEHIETMEKMNKHLLRVRRELQINLNKSKDAAKNIILTA